MRFGYRAAAIIALQAMTASPLLAQTQMELNASAAQAAKSADAALNAQYKATSKKLSPSARTLLVSAQRSWISFRDQECKFETSGVKGGSAYPMVYAGCLETLSKDRTRQLKAFAQCQEGDLSCPR